MKDKYKDAIGFTIFAIAVLVVIFVASPMIMGA